MKTNKMLATAMATLLVVSGCSNNGGSTDSDIVTEITEPVTITFWHGMSKVQEETLKALTDEFNKANENITVELMNQGAYSDLQQKLTAAQASPDQLPTLTQAYPGWMLTAIQDNLVQELDSYITNDVLKIEDYEDILPSLRDGAKVDGKTMGLPFNKSTEVIWYNKTMLDELGLKAPTTMDELVEVSKEIYAKKGIPGAGFDSLSTYYTTFLKMEGVDLDEKFDPTCEASIKAANYYLDGVKEGYFRIAGSDKYLSGPFANEQIAMYIGSSAGESYVKQGAEGKFEYGVARYPGSISIQQGTDIFMFNNGTPEQKTAAFMYLKHLTSKESQTTWAINTGYMPIRSSAIESEEYKNSDSMISDVLKDATSEMYVLKNVYGNDAAFNEARVVLEDILANKDSNVQEKMEAFKETLTTTIFAE